MKSLSRLVPILALLAGCTNAAKPCQTSNDCSAAEVCAAARCQALSCSDTWYAIDPSDGTCRPLPACGNKEEVRAWVACADPCQGLDENSCIFDKRCQPAYATDANATTLTAPSAPPTSVGVPGQPCVEGAGAAGAGSPPSNIGGCGGPPSRRTFVGCHANPLPDDPCKGLDETACKADARCVADSIGVGGGCACPAGAACDCPNIPASPTFECRVKTCGDYTNAKDCEAHPECTDQPTALPTAGAGGGGAPTPVPNLPVPPQPVDGGVGTPAFGCFNRFFGCNGMDEATCLRHGECHPVGTDSYCPPFASCVSSGGKFLFCEPDDGLHRCSSDADCGDGRCSNDDDVCAPPVGAPPSGPIGFGAASGIVPDDAPLPPQKCPGLCVPKGCPGYGEAHCVADPSCSPIYSLNCTPYGGGCGVGLPPNAGAPVPGSAPICDASTCQPTFTGCTDHPLPQGVDADKTVLIREPTVVDDPAFAFPQVMSALAGGKDPAPLVTAWLNQLTQAQTVNGRTAQARTGATAFLSTVARRPDGLIDVGRLGFQTTSLSNRIDLAGPSNCGEARITFALSTGVKDRRHRMTVIVELKQPDDGADCQTVARKWLALGALSGAELTAALKAIYLPMLTPQGLSQLRTNEFLVGPPTSPDPMQNEPWQLREWHLGSNGLLQLAASKQAVDPEAALTPAFDTWVHANGAAVLGGSSVVPDTFLAVTSSENGHRITFQKSSPDDWKVENALNQQACAGCHTTEFNTAFAHVGERFQGTGRAEISEFLRKELPKRAVNLLRAAGGLTKLERLTPKPVH